MPVTVGEQLVGELVAAGVGRVYGLVGDSLNPIIDALRRHEGIDWIRFRNEESAAFAASADSQLNGELAVCGQLRAREHPPDSGPV